MRLSRRKLLYLAGGGAILPAAMRMASALDYPARPIHVIVGFAAATGPDIVARLIAQRLSGRFPQQFIVEDRPGAGSSMAAQDVLNAPADGYTLLLATGANAINATLYPDLSFNFALDIAPVAIINMAPFVMVINPAVPARDIRAFISYAKANPAKINIASPGVGTTPHLCYELFKMMTGVDMVHVPYRASFMTDLISGQVQGAFSSVPQVIDYIKSGKLRALAVTSAARIDTLPEVPTMAEFVPGYEASSWFGVVAPKNTPGEIIKKLNEQINSVVADPGVKAQLVALGIQPLSMNPVEFGKLITDQTDKWAKVITFANIKTR